MVREAKILKRDQEGQENRLSNLNCVLGEPPLEGLPSCLNCLLAFRGEPISRDEGVYHRRRVDIAISEPQKIKAIQGAERVCECSRVSPCTSWVTRRCRERGVNFFINRGNQGAAGLLGVITTP